MHGLVAILRSGGITLAVIIACSLLALALALERLLMMWRFLDHTRTLGETIKRCLYRGALAEARTACERSPSAAAEIFLVGFERYGRSTDGALEAAVDRERQRTNLALKGHLWLLGTIAASAPFIGLFGTVLGILIAFGEISSTHRTGIDVVGGGIAEALYTTAAGILVAIEALFLYNYFMSRLARIGLEVKLIAEEFVEILRERKSELRPLPTVSSSTEGVGATPASTSA